MIRQSADRDRPAPRAALFFAANPLFAAGALILAGVVVLALIAPLIAPHLPTRIDFSQKLRPPGLDHLMGTDVLGRDIFSRVLYGTRTSLLIGGAVLSLSMLLGVPIGLVAGYFGGRTDTLLMRVADVFLAFPPLLLPITITAMLGAGLFNAMLALAVSWFPWYARILRASVIAIKREPDLSAARTLGLPPWRILIRHVLPNAWGPAIVQGSMDFGYAILATASLSFIGIGARPPAIEWGLMVAEARQTFLANWWTAACPGAAIFLTVLAANLIGDGLRDTLDPRSARRD
jgi:peptide/nickel transport system permease protein